MDTAQDILPAGVQANFLRGSALKGLSQPAFDSATYCVSKGRSLRAETRPLAGMPVIIGGLPSQAGPARHQVFLGAFVAGAVFAGAGGGGGGVSDTETRSSPRHWPAA